MQWTIGLLAVVRTMRIMRRNTVDDVADPPAPIEPSPATTGVTVVVKTMAEPDGSLHVGFFLSGATSASLRFGPESAEKIGVALIGEASRVRAGRAQQAAAASAIASGVEEAMARKPNGQVGHADAAPPPEVTPIRRRRP